ncbi:MAG: FAD-binding oxidoreductase [Neisseria sp.]|nr:FAD-binding oxidoreductase [Neisseria sp.]
MNHDLHRLFLSQLAPDEILNDAAAIEPLLWDDRGRFYGAADIVLQPRAVASVQKILRLCHENRIAVTPQGGNTGLCGAATPAGGVLLLLHRLNHIGAVNHADRCITVGAGAVLQQVQAAVRAENVFFPLSLASEGSCQIGGNLACNAGGINVLRYGTARDLVLGLEVVLPDGSLISQLAPLHKNTTGLDIKQLFIGSEGTLGIITAATLKLFPAPHDTATLWANCTDIAACVRLLNVLRRHCGDRVKSFEMISAAALSVSLNDLQQTPPAGEVGAWQVLCDLENEAGCPPWQERLPEILLEHGFDDVLLAQNDSQRARWWQLREHIAAAQKRRGVSLKHDIAMPIATVADFVTACGQAVQAAFPHAEIVLFGHLGDGSLHYNVFLPDLPDKRAYAHEDALNQIVYRHVLEHRGTIAAEHGIGVMKREWLQHVRTPAEIAIMRALKNHLDPHHIMNPGKVLPD